MAVKRIQSAARVLTVLEKVAQHQPIGVSELARLLNDDKSAVQRAIMTLADEGWIRPQSGTVAKWELTNKVHALSRDSNSHNDLMTRARLVLPTLRDQFDETALLTAVDGTMLVLVDAVESSRLLRFVPPTGLVIEPHNSAAGNAILPHMPLSQQQVLLGRVPDAGLLEQFALTLERGYSTSEGLISPDTVSLAAAVFDEDKRPVAALVITGPATRMSAEKQALIGPYLAKTAQTVSQ